MVNELHTVGVGQSEGVEDLRAILLEPESERLNPAHTRYALGALLGRLVIGLCFRPHLQTNEMRRRNQGSMTQWNLGFHFWFDSQQ